MDLKPLLPILDYFELDFLSKGRKGRRSAIAPATPTRPAGPARAIGPTGSTKPTERTPSVHDMLHTAAKKKQAVFKIISYAKGRKRVAAQISYISRKGALELTTAQGETIKTKEGQAEILSAWETSFGKGERDVVHMLFSAPPGSDPKATKKAAENLLRQELGKQGHDYVFVLHTDTACPHVHAIVNLRSCYSGKLDPRKAYLYEMRKKFAEHCRAQGIDVEASPRWERGLAGKSASSKMAQMRRRGKTPKKDQELRDKVKKDLRANRRPPDPSAAKRQRRNYLVRQRYAQRAKELAEKAKSMSDPAQRQKYEKAASMLKNHADTLPSEKTRRERLWRQLQKEAALGR